VRVESSSPNVDSSAATARIARVTSTKNMASSNPATNDATATVAMRSRYGRTSVATARPVVDPECSEPFGMRGRGYRGDEEGEVRRSPTRNPAAHAMCIVGKIATRDAIRRGVRPSAIATATTPAA